MQDVKQGFKNQDEDLAVVRDRRACGDALTVTHGRHTGHTAFQCGARTASRRDQDYPRQRRPPRSTQAATMSSASHRSYPISPSVDHSYAVSPTASTFYTSRSTYPNFLSLQDTLRVHVSCAWRGLVDASRWDTVIRLVARYAAR